MQSWQMLHELASSRQVQGNADMLITQTAIKNMRL